MPPSDPAARRRRHHRRRAAPFVLVAKDDAPVQREVGEVHALVVHPEPGHGPLDPGRHRGHLIGHPHDGVVEDLPHRPTHDEVVRSHRVPPLVVGEVVAAHPAGAEVDPGQGGFGWFDGAVVGPAGRRDGIHQLRGKGPGRHGRGIASDLQELTHQGNGMVEVGRADQHRGRGADDAGPDDVEPRGMQRHQRILLGDLDQISGSHIGPQSVQLRKVGGGRGFGEHGYRPLDQLSREIRRHRPRHAEDHEIRPLPGQQLVDGVAGRHSPVPLHRGGRLRSPGHHSGDPEALGHQVGHPQEDRRPPPGPDQGEAGLGDLPLGLRPNRGRDGRRPVG